MASRRSRRPPRISEKPTGNLVKPVQWGKGRVAVLGIDPATRHIGFVTLGWRGELLDYLQWNLPGKMSIEDRLPLIRKGIQNIIREEQPAAVAYEQGTGEFAAAELDVLLRRIPTYCEEMGVPAVKYTPSQWRMTVCGNGSLGKVEAWGMMLLGYPDFRKIPEKSKDTRDAYGIARCWWERNQPNANVELFDPSAKIVRATRFVTLAEREKR